MIIIYEHHTKTFGDLGVLKAQVDLYQKGYLILNPITEHAPFDLVVYKDGNFKRVQVKSRTVDARGGVTVRFANSYCNTKGVVTKEVDKDEIDIYCVYIPSLDKCYYFNPKEFNSKSVYLRIKPPKNNQKKGVKLIGEYVEIPT